MHYRRSSCLPLICLAMTLGGQAQAEEALVPRLARALDGKLQQTERRIMEVEARLATLARIPLEQTGERLGYHSRILQGSPEPLWVQVDLGASEAFDTVVIVPVVLPKEQGGIEGYGFPVRFKVEVSDEAAMTGARVVSDQTGEDVANPGRTPIIIRCREGHGRYLRLTVAVAAGRKGRDGKVAWPSLALAEVMVLRGDCNLAAGQAVSAPTSREAPPVWSLENLTDSESILGPPVSAASTERKGWHSIAYADANTPVQVRLDLGEVVAIEDVRLFPMRWTGYPHWVGFGFPVRYMIEASVEESFLHPISIANHTQADFPNPGTNPVVLPASGIRARHVRLTTTRLWERFTDHAIALSEVQVFSGGRNVARGAKVETTSVYPDKPWFNQNLVDGDASDNPILPLPEWLGQLEQSSAMEKMLAAQVSERESRLGQWQAWVVRTGIGLGALALALPSVFLIRNSLRRRRDLRQLRERIARDLHDEVGSNLAGIALLTREAEKADPETRAALLEEIQRVAQETSGSMHDLVWMIQPGAPGDMVTGLRALSERMLKGMKAIRFHHPTQPWRGSLSLEARRELYLMCKEALQNMVKHSGATEARIGVEPMGRTLAVTIHDNGKGFDPASVSANGFGLNNLRERAKRLGGTCEIESIAGSGTTVKMRVPLE